MYETTKFIYVPKWETDADRIMFKHIHACAEGARVAQILPINGKDVCGFYVPSNVEYVDRIK